MKNLYKTLRQHYFSQQPVIQVVFKWFAIACFIAIIFFANRQLQSYWGAQARIESGLTSLSLDKAVSLAHETDQLILVDMSAIWCPTCRKLDQKVFSNAQVKKELTHTFIFARVDYNSPQGEMFMRRYHVKGFPTLVILNAQAEKLVTLPLTFDPQVFLMMLQKVIKANNSLS